MGILRLLLALAVVDAHTTRLFPFQLIYSDIAVKTFFVISGFYMALILGEKYNRPNTYSLFITNRFLRIYPIYFFVLGASLLMFLWLPANDPNNHLTVMNTYLDGAPWWKKASAVFANIFIFGQDLIYCFWSLDAGRMFFLPQAWTLSLEFYFYLLAPFLVRLQLNALIAIFIGTFALRLLCVLNDYPLDPWQFRFFPIELGSFLLGICSYKIYTLIRERHVPVLFNTLMFAAALVLIFAFRSIAPVVPFSLDIYFFVLFITLPFIFHLTRSNKIDRWLGEFSYPIYITHVLVKYMFVSSGIMRDGEFWLGWAVAGISFLFSFVLLYGVIYPMDKIREQRYLSQKV